MKILICDPLHQAGLDLLDESGIEYHLLTDDERGQLLEIVGNYDAMIVRSMTKVTAEMLEAGKTGGEQRLKVVGRAGIGVDNVDVAAATTHGILVVNAPTANLISATEHTFALLLAVARNVPAADASLKSGEWNRKQFLGTELQGKTLGIIGLGRIGQNVALRAQAFDMKTIAYDPFLDAAVARRLDIEGMELDEVLANADVLTLHVPLTDQTRNLIDREAIAKMKPGVIIVNCARGGTLDEDALIEALDSGHVAAAGLDVFTEEPPTDYEPLRHRRLVTTPHIGAQTREAQERVATETVKQLLAALEGSLTITAVNLPFRTAGTRGEPYLNLAEQLGRLASTVLGGGYDQLQVDLWGIDEDLQTSIAVAAVKGVLSPFLGETVNYVNAEHLAEARGIEVVRAVHQGGGDYPNLIGLSALRRGAEDRTRRVALRGPPSAGRSLRRLPARVPAGGEAARTHQPRRARCGGEDRAGAR